MSAIDHDVEKGSQSPQIVRGASPYPPDVPPQTRSMYPGESLVSSTQTAQHPQRPLAPRYPSMMPTENAILSAFRYHVGIVNDPSLRTHAPAVQQQQAGAGSSRSFGDIASMLAGRLSSTNTAVSSGTGRPATNVGIYQRVVAKESQFHREYRTWAIVINSALGLQIIFAAALTALGAGNGSHYAVTAFGALNTILAGLLTFLKGSGLPNRLKYYENEWSKLREYIEQRERDFASEYHLGPNPWDELAQEIAHIETMYDTTRKDIEANTPDSYVSMSNAVKSLQQGSNGQHPPPALAKVQNRLSAIASKYAAAEEDVRHRGNDLNSKLRSGISDAEHRLSKGWGDLEKRTTVQIHEVIDDAHHRALDTGKQAEHRVVSATRSLEDGLQQAGNTVESRLYTTQDAAQSALRDGGNSEQSTFRNAQNRAESSYYNAERAGRSAIDDTGSRLQDAQDSAQSKLYSTQARLNESQQHAQDKTHEMEDKIAMVAEKAAEKVLELVRNRHPNEAQK